MSDHETGGPMDPRTPGESREDRLRRLLDERAQKFPAYGGVPTATVRRARRAAVTSALVVTVAIAGIGAGAFAGIRTLSTGIETPATQTPSPAPTGVGPSESPSPSASPSPTSSSAAGGLQVVAPLDGPVSRLAIDAAAVYGIFQKDPSNQSSTAVARMEIASGSVTQNPIPFARNVALAGGWLWVTAANPDQASGGVAALYRLDPRTLATQDTVQMPEAPGALVLTAGGLWVGGTGHLYLLDPGDGRMILEGGVAVDGQVGALATDPVGRVLYVSTHPGPDLTPLPITEHDAETGSVLATGGQLPGLAVNSLSATDQGVWVAFPTGTMSQVAFLSSSDLGQLASYAPAEGEGVTNSTTADAVGGTLWIADSMASRIVCADASTGDLRAVAPAFNELSGGFGFSNVVTAGDRAFVGTGSGIVAFPIDAKCSGS